MHLIHRPKTTNVRTGTISLAFLSQKNHPGWSTRLHRLALIVLKSCTLMITYCLTVLELVLTVYDFLVTVSHDIRACSYLCLPGFRMETFFDTQSSSKLTPLQLPMRLSSPFKQVADWFSYLLVRDQCLTFRTAVHCNSALRKIGFRLTCPSRDCLSSTLSRRKQTWSFKYSRYHQVFTNPTWMTCTSCHCRMDVK